jgi:hypothetical protein
MDLLEMIKEALVKQRLPSINALNLQKDGYRQVK